MLKENIELTMSHAGLSHLNEFELLVLFGNAHSHHLVKGTGVNPSQITDTNNNVLYPAYFMTHLTVPPHCLLSNYKLWDKVNVGVEIFRFGDTLLESEYILSKDTAVPDDIEAWDKKEYPSMTGNSVFIIGPSEDYPLRRVSAPRSDTITKIDNKKNINDAVMRSHTIRKEGFENTGGKLRNGPPIEYTIREGRDAADGHAMIFAKFSQIMDFAEYTLLFELLEPGFPSELLKYLSVIDREVYYYGNCYAGETLKMNIEGGIDECPIDYHGDALDRISSALFTFQIEIYNKRNNALVSIAKVTKLLVVPSRLQNILQDVKRLVSIHG